MCLWCSKFWTDEYFSYPIRRPPSERKEVKNAVAALSIGGRSSGQGETSTHELCRDPSARPTIHANSRRIHNATRKAAGSPIQCLSCILGNFQTLGSRPRSGGQPSIAVSRAQLSGVPVVSSADNRQIPLLSCKAAPSEREGGQERGGQRYRSEID